MPVNGLLIRALLNLYQFYGDDFKVECPTGSGKYMTLFEVAKEIEFQEDPHWKDYVLFYEYFHGDNGAGLGANHQTGWTGLIARNLDWFARLAAAEMLSVSRDKLVARLTREQVAGQ